MSGAAIDAANVCWRLNELRRDWYVELSTAAVTLPEGWRLKLVPRSGPFSARTYVGPDLSEVVRRAHAGEAPDFRSR